MKKNKPQVVVDTNIFVKSWFDDNNDCSDITELISENKIKLLFSQETIGELMYIVKKHAIKNMSSGIPRIEILQEVARLFYESESVNTIEATCPDINDEYDEMFLKCALKANADFLVSDDFNSGLHELEGLQVEIVSSKDFIKKYRESIAS